MAAPDFWNDSQEAQKISQRLARLKQDVEQWNSLESQAEDIETLLEMAEEEEDASLHEEIQSELVVLEKKRKRIDRRRSRPGAKGLRRSMGLG